MVRFALVNWTIAGLFELLLVAIYYYSPREQPAYYVLALSLFAAVYLLAAFQFHHDGFALGSMVVALVFELAIYFGWTHSPQLEEPTLLWTASAMPFIFIVIVFLFNYLQRES